MAPDRRVWRMRMLAQQHDEKLQDLSRTQTFARVANDEESTRRSDINFELL